MSVEERLQDYNSIYHFKEDPDKYSFELNPERVIIRNAALREGDADLYASYLRKAYPESVEREMEQFEKSLADTELLGIDQAQDFFTSHGITVLQSDIAHFEDDAIFVAKIFSQSEADVLVERSSVEPLQQYLTLDMISSKQKIWIDASEVRNIYHKEAKP